MPKDLTVVLEDRPGTLADVGEALGKAGINIDGLCGFPCQGKGILHILVEDAAAARFTQTTWTETALEHKEKQMLLGWMTPDGQLHQLGY